MTFDYKFVQKMSNFGRDMGAKFVGQPFTHYRLTAASTAIPHASSLHAPIDPKTNAPFDLRAKVTPLRTRAQVEGDTLHADTFELLLSSDRVETEDILMQNDPEYGGNAAYCIASIRPLKKVVAVRVEDTCKLFRPDPNSNLASGYKGQNKAGNKPFVLTAGVFAPAAAGTVPTDIPCGITYIGQIKDKKSLNLPADGLTTWWYIYLPYFPGLDRVRENDILEVRVSAEEVPVNYRVHAPFIQKVGVRGVFLLVERMTY